MRKMLACCAFLAFLAGCGSGGSSNSNNPQPASNAPVASSAALSNSSSPSSVPSSALSSLVSVSSSSSLFASLSSSTSSSRAKSSTASSQGAVNQSSVSQSSLALTHYLPVGVNALRGKDLILVDSASPTNIQTILSNLTSEFEPVPMADYNAASGTLANLRPAYVVYISNGRLYKVDLNPPTGQPARVQLSNETQAASSCPNGSLNTPVFLESFADYVPTATVIFYKAATENGCVNKAVSVGMAASDTPITLGELDVLVPYLNTSNGRIAGFLVKKDGMSVGTVDTQLANFVPLANFSIDAEVSYGSRISALLTIDGTLKRFDFATGQLSSAIITFPAESFTRGMGDNSAYYLSGPEIDVQGNITNKIAIYKLTDSVSPILTNLFSSSDPELKFVDLTPTKILLQDGTSYSVLPKTGGAPVNLAIPLSASALGGNGERIFYSDLNFLDLSQSIFGSILSNNSGSLEFKGSIFVLGVSSSLSLYSDAGLDKLLVLEYAAGSLTFAKANLSLVSASTGQKVAQLGSLPDIAYDSFDAESYRFGALGFCRGITEKCDAFFHTNNSNSLVRLTQFVQ